MSDEIVTVALDAMGGDEGLSATVYGAARLSREDDTIQTMLVGDIAAMSEALEGVSYDPRRLILVASQGHIRMDEKPLEALRAKPECSISTAARLVASGEADALVSAGHTGATILAASKNFERLPGIRRAALASVYPTGQWRGPRGDPFALLLDVGATLKATADDLVGFAVMGAAYSSIVSELVAPRVALLSNGTEANKGTRPIVMAHQRLLKTSIDFRGNIEGLDIPRGSVDVVVCDGFLGNVVLKMLEGVSDVVRDLAKEAASRRLQWRLGLSMLGGGLRELNRLTDWKMYGGAPLLGFDHVIIKAHGRSEARAIRNALKISAKAVRGDLIRRITDGIHAIDGVTQTK
jgi:glycerol-3-phosphate acyltransferase PlsX